MSGVTLISAFLGLLIIAMPDWTPGGGRSFSAGNLAPLISAEQKRCGGV
jgi:hypothetical protein